jgi:hypothetical protein
VAKGSRSETSTGLARAEHSQYLHVARCLVATSVGIHLIERPVAAIAGQFTHADMLTDWPEAGMLAKALNATPDGGQPAPCPRSRSRLRQPACGYLEVSQRLGRVDQLTGQPQRGVFSVAAGGAGRAPATDCRCPGC